MEHYGVSWTPSPSTPSLITKQQVLAVIAGAVEAPLTPTGATTPDLAPGIPSAEFDFPTDAEVTLVIATVAADGSVVRSDPFTFTAADHETVLPATGISVKWLNHTPGNG